MTELYARSECAERGVPIASVRAATTSSESDSVLMPSNSEQHIENIEQRVEKARSLLKYAPRAFVMEFAGTPKSGKSTSVEAIRHLFARHGFRVHLLAERAALCPIPMKGHLFFNTWCAASMLAELLANVEAETDIILVDRGLFDALVWLSLQEKRREVTAGEARTVESFLLLERWRSLFDLNVVMSVSVEKALAREDAQRLTKKRGSIMQPDMLAALKESVDQAVTKYRPKFRAVIPQDTTDLGIRDSLTNLANEILAKLEDFLNPEILVVKRRPLEELKLEKCGSFGHPAFNEAIECVEKYGQFVDRNTAESDKSFVQIISCGVLEHEDDVFLFRRKETDPKYRLYGRGTVWRGCHVQKGDNGTLRERLESALAERITYSLFISRVFPIAGVGYCWDRDNPDSAQHFGVVYRVSIDNPDTADDLRKKEFRKQRGHDVGGQFQKWSEVATEKVRHILEPWSLAILDGIGTLGDPQD